MTNKHYRRSNEVVCPFCRSDELEWDELTVNGRAVKQEVRYDVYKLKGYGAR